jgi:hypothetical protein
VLVKEQTRAVPSNLTMKRHSADITTPILQPQHATEEIVVCFSKRAIETATATAIASVNLMEDSEQANEHATTVP